MTYVPLLLSLMAVDLLAAISPGPNFVLVTQTAIQRNSRCAWAVVVGLVTSNLIWCCAVTFGLSALFAVSPWIYRAIKLLGGAYLIYLGLTLWRTHDRAASGEVPFRNSIWSAYLRGMLTNLTNPKSVVYFGSIFVLFMSPRTPAWVQGTAVGIVLFDTVLWYGTVAAVFSREVVRRFSRAVQRSIDRAAGAVMIAFGARLTFAPE